MKQEQLKNIIEAALMVTERPLNLNRLLGLFENEPDQPERSDIRAAIEELQQDYLERGIELKEISSGYRFQARSEYGEWINRLFEEKPPRYSRALMETMAIIAYRQPITRGEIEDIRGVSVSSSITKTLQEREWIKIVGHRDIPGKPELLATTKQFLDYFNLRKLADLPALAEIKDFNDINPDLFDSLEGQGVDDSDQNNHEQAEEITNSSEDNELENTAQDEIIDEVETSETNDEAVSSEEKASEEEAKVIPFSN